MARICCRYQQKPNSTDLCKVQIQLWHRIVPGQCEKSSIQGSIIISKPRTSSHALEVERGRHTKPKTPLEERLCPNCHVLEDEQHFVMECTLYETQRRVLINNIITTYPEFSNRNVNDAFVFLLQSTDPNIQNLLQNSYTTPFKQKHPVWMHKADRTQSRVLYIGCAYSCMSEIIFTQPIEVETNCPLLFQTTISNTFFWMKMYEFRWIFHWICLWCSNNNNIPGLARIMAWCQPGDRPLSGPTMVNSLTHMRHSASMS